MHFIAAVPDGEELCKSIGDDVFEDFEDLTAGKVPVYTVDVDSEPTESRPCDEDDQGDEDD